MSHFLDQSLPEEERRNAAFTHLIALREALTIATRRSQPVTYRRAFRVLHDVSPDTYDEFVKLITRRNESDLVKYYKQKAKAQSKATGNQVEPADVIKKEIKDEEALLVDDENVAMLQRKIIQLEAALEFFEPEDISENSLLNHDFSNAKLPSIIEQPLYGTSKIKDYKLSEARILRLRLLHPDKAEREIGSDLVYEQFDLRENKVRFVHLQYKTWNTIALYFSTGNLASQIEKLNVNFCTGGYCHSENGTKYSDEYRFPNCSAFLRPTSALTKPDSPMITTGLHIPICEVRKLQQKEASITPINSRNCSVDQDMFHHLFVQDFIGSRWIPIEELEKFYKDKGLNSEVNKIRVHAQEIIKDEEVKSPEKAMVTK